MTGVALDACLCLLLVSAAAVTVTSVPQQTAAPDRADAVAETVAATTAEVEYSLQPVPTERVGTSGEGEHPRTATGPEYDRIAHGTLAALLARAAVRTVRVDGEPLTETNAGFAAAVRVAVRERLPSQTQVVVSFRPYPGAHLGREIRIGPTPPPEADVNAARIEPPSGVDGPDHLHSTIEQAGFDGLGHVVASALVEGLFPPGKGRLALVGDAPVDRLVRHRYARASSYYGAATSKAIDDGNTQTANDKLAAAMAEQVSSELRNRFDSPEQAARKLRLRTVDISVRTWDT